MTYLKIFDLEERTLLFAKNIRSFIKKIPRTIANTEDSKQLIRSSGSIGANYREANDSFSKKDFLLRIKIARKEAKESIYWLKLLDVEKYLDMEKQILIQEATELMRILSAIINKREFKQNSA